MKREDFKIEKDIPIPHYLVNTYVKMVSEMKEGDSVEVKTDAARVYICTIFRRLKVNFISCKQEDQTYRIWHKGKKK